MPLPLLLFDCDGTLVDSEPLLAEEMARGLNTVGLPFASSDYLGSFVVPASDALWQNFKPATVK